VGCWGWGLGLGWVWMWVAVACCIRATNKDGVLTLDSE